MTKIINELVVFDKDLNECILCDNSISIFAYGSCKHHTCFVCASKMRLICNQMYCPVCRCQLDKVYFSRHRHGIDQISENVNFNKHGICFVDDDIKEEFEKLFENRCALCETVFYDFDSLSNHMTREHRRLYCSICLRFLKLFPHERKFYTREEFAKHSMCGDSDDSSFVGHPLCAFCKKRFYDKDELYRHSTVEHYYCSFCAADGKITFYREYEELRNHFRKNHFLCEHDTCRTLELSSHVFQSEIELKTHVLEMHTKSTKQAQRQAGMLSSELLFDFESKRSQNDSQSQERILANSLLRMFPAPVANKVQCEFNEDNFPTLGLNSNQTDESKIPDNSGNQIRCWLSNRLPTLENSVSTSKSIKVETESSNLPRTHLNPTAYASAATPSKKFDLDHDEFPSLPFVQNSKKAINPASKLFNWGIPSTLHKKESIHKQVISKVPSKQVKQTKPIQELVPKPSDFPSLARPSSSVKSSKHQNRSLESQCWDLKSIGKSLISSGSTNADAEINNHDDANRLTRKTKFSSSQRNIPEAIIKKEVQSDTSTPKIIPLVLLSNEVRKTNSIDRKSLKNSLNPENFPELTSHGKQHSGLDLANQSHWRNAVINTSLTVESNISSLLPEATTVADHLFIPPARYEQRKGMLACKVRDSVGDNELLFSSFKRSHREYCMDNISVVEFYNQLADSIGTKAMMTFIYELISLLPDINKQQELYQTVQSLLRPLSKTEKRNRLSRYSHWNIEPLQRCTKCSQLIETYNDFVAHCQVHRNS